MKKIKLLVLALTILSVPCGVFAQQKVTVNTETTTESAGTAGTVSEMTPDGLVIHSETNASPTHYTYTKSTTYVDDAGVPVSLETVKSGMPVTVHYTKVGDRMTATKVVVWRTMTTTEAPTIIKMQTATTTTTGSSN